jgi:hypothetical protein
LQNRLVASIIIFMKSKLQKLEALIQELIEVRMVSLLPGQKLEQDVLQKLAAAIQASVSNKSETGAAPNIFTLVVPPALFPAGRTRNSSTR